MWEIKGYILHCERKASSSLLNEYFPFLYRRNLRTVPWIVSGGGGDFKNVHNETLLEVWGQNAVMAVFWHVLCEVLA